MGHVLNSLTITFKQFLSSQIKISFFFFCLLLRHHRASLLLWSAATSLKIFIRHKKIKGTRKEGTGSMDMYIRVKRSKTTYFIRCSPSDKIVDIKQKLQELVDQPVNNQRLVLPGTGQVLEDSRTLADQKVENDAVVALTLRKDDNEFEEVNIVQPNDFYQSRDADGASW